jgi:hypothetical protein
VPDKYRTAATFVTLALAALTGAAALAVEDPMPSKKTQTTARKTDKLAERVRTAFDAARKGELQPSAELAQAGRPVAPYVAPFVKDASRDVRRQAVAVLGAVGGKAALAPLLKALGDPETDIQEAAATAIFDGYAPKAVAAEPGAGAALREAALAGTKSPAVPLLLAYFPGPATVDALEKLRRRDSEAQTRLRSWSLPVAVSVPVNVALSRLGSGDGRKELLAMLGKGEQGELEFLLDALREVDSPEVLHAIARTLDDTRPVDNRVPSGVEPRPRLCDVAVGAYINRLKLRVGFEVNSAGQYTPEQIEQVRKAIRLAIPQ